MGEWYEATFGAEKPVVGKTTAAQRDKTFRDRPFLTYKMYRDPAVGVLQDRLIELNAGPKAKALAFKIKADPTDHGDFGPATSAAIEEFQMAVPMPATPRSVNKILWAALIGSKANPGGKPVIKKITEADIVGFSKWPSWLKWLIGGGLVVGAGKALAKKHH